MKRKVNRVEVEDGLFVVSSASSGDKEEMKLRGKQIFEKKDNPKGKYLLFAGDNQYPDGGWNDFKGSFQNKENAIETAKRHHYDWWHVVDSQIQEEV